MKKSTKAKKVTPASKKRVPFRLAANPSSEVFLAGTFNDWDPKKHCMKDKDNNGNYSIMVLLPKGRHEYKFIVNGSWMVDPECQNWVRNSLGTLNSLITVE